MGYHMDSVKIKIALAVLSMIIGVDAICGQTSASQLRSASMIAAGNQTQSDRKSSELVEFEDQLDLIEKNFWFAASLPYHDSFRRNFEKQLSDLVILSRNIQSRLVHRDMATSNTNMPQRTLRIRTIWQRFSKKKTYSFRRLRCSSRRCFYGLRGNNKSKDDYFRWLDNTMITNTHSFRFAKDNVLSVSVSDFYMAVKELRVAIVELDESGLFEENPHRSVPDANNVITGTANSGYTKPPKRK